jgi:threonine dehydratase
MNKRQYPHLSIEEVKATSERLSPMIRKTPVWQWIREDKRNPNDAATEVFLKLELFQKTGTFKARGALNSIGQLTPEELKKGVTTFSGGNHAVAIAYASRVFGTSAKVVMPSTANPARRDLARYYGADVILVPSVHEAVTKVKQIEEEEGRIFIHPFDGPQISLATGTIGLELLEQVPGLEAIVIPIGGGGLCSGIAAVAKQLNPRCQVYGVEPEGASSMYLSIQQGTPAKLEKVQTIADSLGAPSAMPYSFDLCRKYVDDVVLVKDNEMVDAMRILYDEMKLAVEPAAAAATAALFGPLKERLTKKRVALVVCGSNIDIGTYSKLMSQ